MSSPIIIKYWPILARGRGLFQMCAEAGVPFEHDTDMKGFGAALFGAESTNLAPPIIIFCNGKRGCDILAKSLDKMGYPTATIHSGKDQATREQAIDGFKSGEFEILVATDIAGRGIDIQGVEHVINYDMPKDIESYTHRIGRTGRAGRKGVATTFVTGEGLEENVLWDLAQMLKKCGQPVPNDLARHPACCDPEQREFRKKHPKVVEAKK